MTQSPMAPKIPISPEKKSGSKGWIILAILLLLVIAAILIWYVPMKNKYLGLLNEKELQQIELQNELNKLMMLHDSIKAEYGTLSDSLSVKDSIILANAKEIQDLLNYKWEYRKVNKKLDMLRQITQGYVHQIDSLYTVNHELKEENEKIRQQYSKEQDKSRELIREKGALVDKVKEATVLRAYNVSAVGIRSTGSGRERETDKAKKIEQVKVCFTLGENKLTEPGIKTVYLRILRPDNVVVTQKVGEDYSFTFQDQQLEYTTKKEIDYQNKDLSTCMFWNKKNMEEAAMIGVYNISVYVDGYLIGEASFELF